MLNDLYRQVIIDHHKRRRNYYELQGEGVYKLRARHNCALMPWQAYDKMLKALNRME